MTKITITASTVTTGVRLKPSSRNASAGACGCTIRPMAETMPVKDPIPTTAVAASPNRAARLGNRPKAKKNDIQTIISATPVWTGFQDAIRSV